jgi:amino acid adenylation domain-containing protein
VKHRNQTDRAAAEDSENFNGSRRALSGPEERFWFVAQKNPNHKFHHCPLGINIAGTIRSAPFEQAFSDLIARHRSLRAHFHEVPGSVERLISPIEKILPAIKFVNLTENDGNGQAYLRGAIADNIARPFDLAVPPLWRVLVFRFGPSRTYIHLCFHHLISDALSLDILIRELAELYTAATESRPPALDSLDNAIEIDEPLGEEEYVSAWSYWRDQMEGASESISLPFDFPRPAQTDNSGGVLVHLIDKTALNRLKEAATSLEATPQMILLAAYAASISRISGQQDFVIGSMLSGRRSLHHRRVVGCFANTAALRFEIKDGAIACQVVSAAREATVGAIRHQYFPFQQLVARMVERREQGDTSLFSVLFVHHSCFRDPNGCFAGLPAKIVFEEEEQASSEFDLFLQTFERDEGLRLALQYRKDLFRAETINRILDAYVRILAAIVADPAIAIASIDVISPGDREKLLNCWQGERSVVGTDSTTVVHLTLQQAARNPEAIAAAGVDRLLTYQEMDQASARLANRLRSLDLRPEERIGVLLNRSVDTITGILGVLRSRCAYVPLDPNFPFARLKFAVSDTQITVLIVNEETAKLGSSLASRIVLVSDLREHRDDHELTCSLTLPSPSDLAYVIYTSGSTGEPKGVAIQHSSLLNLVTWSQRQFTAEELSGVLCASSVCFDSSVFEIFAPLCAGGTVILADNLLATPAMSAMERVRLFVTGAPSVLGELIRERGLPPGVKSVVLAGEPVSRSLVKRVYAHKHVETVYNIYGPTEGTVYSTIHKIARDITCDPPIGRPLTNVSAYVLDGSMRLVPVGTVGELYIGGACLSRGYHNQAELTAAKFVQNPFLPAERLYRTGDLARYTHDGQLEYVSRIDRQVKIRGYRIETGEIEARLDAHPAMQRSIVVSRGFGDRGTMLVAYLKANGPVPSVADLREYLGRFLPVYMIPAFYVYVESFPLTANGKIDFAALPPPAATTEANQEPPASDIEREVMRIWCELLEVPTISPESAFFDVGGNSLLLYRLAKAIADSFDVALAITSLFANPSIRTQARLIERSPSSTRLKNCGKRSSNNASRTRRGFEIEGESRGDMAVVGAACRVPGASTPDEFWRIQIEEEDCIAEVPTSRSPTVVADARGEKICPRIRYGGFLADIEAFDPQLFRISNREARLMDPQQRILLEVTYEAFERAGISLHGVRNKRVGLFVGASSQDQQLRLVGVGQSCSPYASSGTALSMLANRISYVFGFTGPSLTVDTACSSSLVALHLARQSLIAGECDLAVVGGVSLLLAPETVAGWEASGMLATDGRCRSFDEQASGFGASEGVIVFILKRYSEAACGPESVWALLKGTAINHDGGNKMGLTVPNPSMHAEVILRALQAAGASAESISYVEAHGSGTKLGDPLEFNGLVQAFRSQTDRVGFCGLGCVKSNIGHMGPAAGLAGALKVLLALSHRELPKILHLQTPSSALTVEGSPFRLCSVRETWNSEFGVPRRAGVSSFGFGGSNAHAVFQEAPDRDTLTERPRDGIHLLTISARSRASLMALAKAYRSVFEATIPMDVVNICATANHSRLPCAYRLAIVGRDAGEFVTRIDAVLRSEVPHDVAGVFLGVSRDHDLALLPMPRSLSKTLAELSETDCDRVRQWCSGRIASQWLADWVDSDPNRQRNIISDREAVLSVLGKLFVCGATINWEAVDHGVDWRCFALPTTPFEHDRRGPSVSGTSVSDRTDATPSVLSDTANSCLWYYSWREAKPHRRCLRQPKARVFFAQWSNFAELLRIHTGGLIGCDPGNTEVLSRVLSGAGESQIEILCCCPSGPQISNKDPLRDLELFFHAAISPLQNVARVLRSIECSNLTLRIITTRSQNVLGGDDVVDPTAAMLWGYAATIAREFPRIGVQCCDLDEVKDGAEEQMWRALADEFAHEPTDAAIAFRGGKRYVAGVAPLDGDGRTSKMRIRPNGRYLVTGGTGGIGRLLAQWLADQYNASTVLLSRFGNRPEPAGAFAHCINTDVVDQSGMESAIEQTLLVLGGLDGVFHLAGLAPRCLAADEDSAVALDALRAKVAGLQILDLVTAGLEMDFIASFSSLASIIGNIRLGSYSAAARFLDSFAAWRTARGRPTVSIGWCGWRDTGMGANAHKRGREHLSSELILNPRDALTLLEPALASGHSHVLISPWAPEPPRFILSPVTSEGVDSTVDPLKLDAATDVVFDLLVTSLENDPDQLDATTPFLEMGLNSIVAVAMIERLETICGRRFSHTLFFDHTNVNALARYLAPFLPNDLTPAVESNANLGSGLVLKNECTTPLFQSRSGGAGSAIAIIGMAARLPEAPNIKVFWRNLMEGRDCIRPIPKNRWGDIRLPVDLPICKGGFLEDASTFDAAVFGISPREASNMDPQQGLLLEVVHEALEDAGWLTDAQRLRTAVFVGASSPVFPRDTCGPLHPDSLIGVSTAVLANRVSYAFDLRGPSMVVDTLCSSSLVAVHEAVESLDRGECDVAIVAGVRIGMSARYFEGAVRSGAISPSGVCRTFDAQADGMVPGEGVIVVVLRRLADASQSRNRIHALVRGTAIGHTGRGSGLTAPRADAQADVIVRALQRAAIDPSTIGYVEAHGTGTCLGDPIEIEGLRKAFGNKAGSASCGIGSLKPNIGHLEPAAGLVGLVKCVCALKTGKLPPTVKYETRNPEITLSDSPFFVVDRSMDWEPAPGIPRRAGVSAFGIGGLNAHAVLEEAPPSGKFELEPLAKSSFFLPLSAHTPTALKALAERVSAYVSDTDDELADICLTAGTGRRHFRYRLGTIGVDRAEIALRLEQFARGTVGPGVFFGQANVRPPRVAFVFAGQGYRAFPLNRSLYETEPVFRTAVDRCAALLANRMPVSLVDILFNPVDQNMYRRADITQPALFSLQYSLTELIRAWGIEPHCVLGHSLGEYVAACVAGSSSVEDALELVTDRARIMQALCGKGAMVAVGADESRIASALRAASGAVCVAAENARGHVILSGSQEGVASAVAGLGPHAQFVEQLGVEIGYHSPEVEPALDDLSRLASKFVWKVPRIAWVSTVTSCLVDSERGISADHWRRHAREPVQYANALKTAAELGCDVFVDMGPSSTMAAIGARVLANRCAWIVGLTGNDDAVQDLYAAAGQLYVTGSSINWVAIDGGPHRPPASLPTYPFEHPAPIAQKSRSHETTIADHPRIGQAVEAFEVQSSKCPLDRLDTECEAIVLRTEVDPDGSKEVERLETIRSIVGEFLGLPAHAIAPELPLVELGANSLTLAGLTERLLVQFKTNISIREVLTSLTTVAALARRIGGAENLTVDKASPPVSTVALADKLGPKDRNRSKPSTNIQPAKVVENLPISDGRMPRSVALDEFISSYVSRTRSSKEIAQRSRGVLADSRAVAGFRPSLKELQYPIVADHARGARIWDVNDNEYIDLVMGFGVQLFGHSSPELLAAARQSLDEGLFLGPQGKRAEEVARRLCAIAGMDRCVFLNSGSEAIMLAVRLARAATGRERIVIFQGSYHGFYDATLATAGPDGRGIPIGAGLVEGVAASVIVLPYGEEESLQVLRTCANEIAAVLVEPVQSRRPGLQPLNFLVELRNLTRQVGAVLLFDEVITGFRVHPGGAQALFGVRADLVVYAKILGGGVPMGAVAGRSHLLDQVDGGFWRFGDSSAPSAERIFCASTFAKNPLALAMAEAVLSMIEKRGCRLQDDLALLTDNLVLRLKRLFEHHGVPIGINSFRSLFRFEVPPDLEVFYYALISHGVYVWEGRTCFLSTAHGEDEVCAILRGAEAAIDDLRKLHLIRSNRKVLSVGVVGGTPPEWAENEVSPASPLQRDIWMIANSSDVASSAYNEAVLVDFSSSFDIEAFRSALDIVSARHDMLRASFRKEDGSLCVLSTAHADIIVEQTPGDLSGLGDIISLAAARPFDLEKAPLLRIHVWQVAERRTLLLVVAHHLIIDADSFDTLLSELGIAYRAKLETLVGLFPPATSYTKIAETWVSSPGQDIGAFWKSRYPIGLPVLDLPVDYVSELPISMTGTRERLNFHAPVEQIARHSAIAGVTPFMMFLAAFQAWLFRVTGHEAVVVGVPVSLRPPGRDIALIGQCATMVPVLASANECTTLAALSSKTREVLLEAAENGRCSVSTLAGLVGAKGRVAPFRVAFNMDPGKELSAFAGFSAGTIGLTAPVKPLDLRDLGGGIVEVGTRTVKQHLELSVRAVDGIYHGCLEASSDLFRTETIRCLADSLEAFVSAVVDSPERDIFYAPLMTKPERHRMLVDLNDTVKPLPIGPHFADLFDVVCNRFPDAVAVEYCEQRLTYRELQSRALQFSGRVASVGIGRGGVVAIYGRRSIDYLVGCVGILLSDAAFMPVDPRDPPLRLASILERSGASAMVVVGEQQDSIRPALDQLQQKISVLTVDDAAAPKRELPNTERDGLALAYVIFTSGSTGEPKGVMIEHRSLVNQLFAKVSDLNLGPSDVVAQTAPPSFDIFIWQFLVNTVTGGKTVVFDDDVVADAAALVNNLSRSKVTVLELVPALLREFLLELERRNNVQEELSSLRWLLVAGEALPANLCERWQSLFPRTPMVNVYGPAECAIDVTHYKVTQPVEARRRAIPIGTPLSNTRLFILDCHRQPVPVGVIGELFIAGLGVGVGYINDCTRSEAAFLPNFLSDEPGLGQIFGWPNRIYRTGDLVRRSGDGLIEFIGRTDTMVKINGQRIELGEIEIAVERHKSVRACCVDVVAAGARTVLAAYVVQSLNEPDATGGARNRNAIVTELRQHLERILPRRMIPQKFVLLDELPRTRTGKLDRKGLPALLINAHSGEEKFSESLSATEVVIQDAFKKNLQLASVPLHESYFDLGGDSLGSIHLLRQIENRLGRRVALSQFLAHPTVRGLASRIEASTKSAVLFPGLAPITIIAGDQRPPLFLVHPSGGDVTSYMALARKLGGHTIHAFASPLLTESHVTLLSVEELATSYVAGLLRICPKGICVLAGWSMGGVVAFEMARQLAAVGPVVNLLILIDSEMPGWEVERFPRDAREVLRLFCDGLGLDTEPEFTKKLMKLEPSKRLQLLYANLHAKKLPASDLSSEALEHRFAVFEKHVRAMWAYRPHAYGGKVLIVSAGRTAANADPSLGWRAVAVDVDCEVVQGDHFSILADPAVSRLAEIIGARMPAR